jgi:hypothetical protein
MIATSGCESIVSRIGAARGLRIDMSVTSIALLSFVGGFVLGAAFVLLAIYVITAAVNRFEQHDEGY